MKQKRVLQRGKTTIYKIDDVKINFVKKLNT
jgi:hypothetical protein